MFTICNHTNKTDGLLFLSCCRLPIFVLTQDLVEILKGQIYLLRCLDWRMESEENSAQRPVTLDISVENVTQEDPDLPEPIASQTLSTDVLQEESINVGGEFATPQEDSSTTPSESLIDKLTDHMMESVIISDSPNNSEEDDVATIDNFLDAGEEDNSTDPTGEEGKQSLTQNATDLKISAEEPGKYSLEEKVEEDTQLQTQVPMPVTASTDAERPTSSEVKSAPQAKNTSPKGEPVPVCTIFSQGAQPRSLMPDGFQPTLIKSPSLSMGSGGGSTEAATPSKTTTPLVCQPSPSLSKFFTDNGQANPGSDFFDSFTAPSSFISVSNPNAELPPGPSPTPGVFTTECQLSSTPSSVCAPEGSVCGSTSTTPSSNPPHTLSPAFQPPPDPPTAAPQPQPFNHLQAVFLVSDDPFAKALNLSEVDRRHDAWLPSEETKKVLIEVATQRYNPAFVDTSRLTMPGLKFDNLQVRQWRAY